MKHVRANAAAIALLSFCIASSHANAVPPAVERGNVPWVFRSVLDKRPRMVTLALSKTLWAAYDTQSAALYKVWRDGVEFDGAVYTTRHGPQPASQGSGYIVNDVTQPWRVIDKGVELTPRVQYLGHRFESGQVRLRYALRFGSGQEVVIEELPEAVHQADDRPIFFRRYELISNPAGVQVLQRMTVQSLKSQGDLKTDGRWISDSVHDEQGGTTVRGTLTLQPKITQLSIKFANVPAVTPPPTVVPAEPGAQLIAASDCASCHDALTKTVGPSYALIADYYRTTPGTVDALARKIISGGSGVWGEIPMSPHPALSMEQARTMVSYILGLDKDDSRGLDLEAPKSARTATQAARRQNLPPGAQPGVTLRYYEIADPVDGLPLISQQELPNKVVVVPSLRMTTFPPFAAGDLGFGEFNKKAKFVIHASGWIYVPVSGEYGLMLWDAEGDSQLFIDSRSIGKTRGSFDFESQFRMQLTEGWKPFRIEYASSPKLRSDDDPGTFLNMLMLRWQLPGSSDNVFPELYATEPPDSARIASGSKAYLLTAGAPGDRLPLEGIHPAFKLVTIRPEDFQPKVAGMDFLPDGRLVLSTWSAEGGVYVVNGIRGNDSSRVTVKQIASGLAEPLGLKVVDGRIYVLQKQELTELIDHDGDEQIDEYRLVSNDWSASDNFHEFAFGLAYKSGHFYAALASAILPGGQPAQPQTPDRGKVVRIDRKTGAVETLVRGLRTPSGIGHGVDDEIFVTDVQGNWLPANKIAHVKKGVFYGFREVDPARDAALEETPPTAWLPQPEVASAPTNPVPLDLGIYKGQMLHGDVTHGGLQRVAVEKINGQYQGCVFQFSQGFEAGINRTAWGPDGALYVGGIGNPGNWGQAGKLFYGLQKLVPTGAVAFEMLAIRVKSNGVEIEFTQPLRLGDGRRPEDYEIRQWRYVPTKAYGGPNVDEKNLPVRSVSLSPDRRRAFLEITGMKARHVLYARIANPFVSAANQEMWTTEGWCTLNAIPESSAGKRGKAMPINTLTPEESEAGWRLLFDGKTTKGWRNFKKKSIDPRWSVEDGALALTAAGGGDIVTDAQFESFELVYEWKISRGGNSGVFFHVLEDGHDEIWRTGPEMQVLDDDEHPDGRLPTHRAGANYDLHPPRYAVTKPIGEYNIARLVVDRGHVEHWLNGRKLVEYDLWTEEWKKKVAASKFSTLPGYGTARSGHIALQDHGDKVWFRNMKIRALAAERE